MVRLIIPTGETMPIGIGTLPASTADIEGPVEILFETFQLSGEAVSNGEYLRAGGQWVQTLPYVREEIYLVGLCAVLGFLLALSWFRKVL